MMPNVDGIEALKRIRAIEKKQGVLSGHEVKVKMTTASMTPRLSFRPITRAGQTHIWSSR